VVGRGCTFTCVGLGIGGDVGGWVTTGRGVVDRVVDRVVVGGSVDVVVVVFTSCVVDVVGTAVVGNDVVCTVPLVGFIESVVVVNN
jgi:hypothetical protein